VKIRRGDSVVVTTGNDKGTTPHKVVQILDGGRKLVIEGVNVVKKHVRRGHPKSPQGGRLDLEMPIDASNVRFYCSSCSKGTKLGLRFDANGQKERFCRKCGAAAGKVGAPKPNHAATK
jgi:large subunit ribosomal protein L24